MILHLHPSHLSVISHPTFDSGIVLEDLVVKTDCQGDVTGDRFMVRNLISLAEENEIKEQAEKRHKCPYTSYPNVSSTDRRC